MDTRTSLAAVMLAVTMVGGVITPASGQGSLSSHVSTEAAVQGIPSALEGLLAEEGRPRAKVDSSPARTDDGFDVQPGVTVHHLGRSSRSQDTSVGTIYASVDESTDLVWQELEGSMRHLLVLHGPDAPEAHRFRVNADVPFELRISEEGGVHVIARDLELEASEDVNLGSENLGVLKPDDVEIAYIEPPWAYDQDGNAIDTRFEVRGRTIVQHIDHAHADTAYPVVADPSYTCGWMNCTIWFNRNETLLVASGAGAAAVGCSFIPFPGSTACALAIAVYGGTAGYHYSRGGCLYIRFVTGLPGVHWAGGHYGGYCR